MKGVGGIIFIGCMHVIPVLLGEFDLLSNCKMHFKLDGYVEVLPLLVKHRI